MNLRGAFRAASCMALLAMALCGCLSSSVYSSVPVTPSDSATVYFLRKAYPPYLYGAEVSDNGNAIATIANNDFVSTKMPAGYNEIDVSIFQGKDISFNLELSRGDTVYVLLYGTVDVAPSHGVLLQEVWKSRIVNRDEAQSIVQSFGRTLN